MRAMSSYVRTSPTSWQLTTSPSASRPYAASHRTNLSARSGQKTRVTSGSTQSITPRDCTPSMDEVFEPPVRSLAGGPKGKAHREANSLPRCDHFVEQREHCSVTPRVVDVN